MQKRYVLYKGANMKVLLMLVFVVILVACASPGMRGTIVGKEYTSPNSLFSARVPEFETAKVVDGEGSHFAFVDFIRNSGGYSIEYFDHAGPEDTEEFESTTLSFMENYIPQKCGPDSFEQVEGHFSTIDGKPSYDFLTQGVRPMGRSTFLYGRSIFLGSKLVAICMLFEDRGIDESYAEFRARFDEREFNEFCSSIEPNK